MSQPHAARAQPPSLAQELRGFAGLAAPMVVSRAGVAALAFTDGVMLARFSSEALAVHGLSESLMGRVLEVSMVAATAGLALAAQAHASGGQAASKVGIVWHNGLLLATGLGLAALALSALGGPILAALGQPATLVSQSALVIGLIGVSALPALLGLVCGGLLETIGHARHVAFAVILANAANIALNQWLIFGGLGVQPLGAVGAALSTLVVRVLMAVGLLALLWRIGGEPTKRALGLRQRFDRQAWAAGAEQRRRGGAAAATVGVLALVSFGLPIMAGWLGAQALAEVTALFLCLVPVLVLAWGLADAAAVRLAAVAGSAESSGSHLRHTGWQLVLPLALILGALALAISLGGESFARLIIRNPELTPGVLALMGLGLMVAAGDALSVLFGAMLRSLGVLRGPFVAQALGSLALLPLAAALAFGAGWQLKGLLVAQGGIALARAAWLALMFDRVARARDRSSDAIHPALRAANHHPSTSGHRPAPVTFGPDHRAP